MTVTLFYKVIDQQLWLICCFTRWDGFWLYKLTLLSCSHCVLDQLQRTEISLVQHRLIVSVSARSAYYVECMRSISGPRLTWPRRRFSSFLSLALFSFLLVKWENCGICFGFNLDMLSCSSTRLQILEHPSHTWENTSIIQTHMSQNDTVIVCWIWRAIYPQMLSNDEPIQPVFSLFKQLNVQVRDIILYCPRRDECLS